MNLFLTEQEGLKIIPVELSHRFETFTVEIHNLIEREGRDAFFVFDCLSELQTAWATDLMMGNFFKLTCPFLFQLDTVAFFPLIRGKHSFKAIAKIRDTTQLFLDVFSDSANTYVRPLKVWNRYSETMFLPPAYDKKNNTFRPLTAGVSVSRFYQLMNTAESSNDNQNVDSWDRFFNHTQELYKMGMDVSKACDRMCDIMMTRDEKMRKMIKENFSPIDYFQVRSRMVGTGMIGGKGLLWSGSNHCAFQRHFWCRESQVPTMRIILCHVPQELDTLTALNVSKSLSVQKQECFALSCGLEQEQWTGRRAPILALSIWIIQS